MLGESASALLATVSHSRLMRREKRKWSDHLVAPLIYYGSLFLRPSLSCARAAEPLLAETLTRQCIAG